MTSKAYVIPDGSYSDVTDGKNEWLVLKATLGFRGRINGGKMIPIGRADNLDPSFNMIGTDEESIKKEMCRIIDEIMSDNT